MITLIHPSRGRADKALATFKFWLENAKCPENIEHIVSLDADDPEIAKYVSNFKDIKESCGMVNENTCVVEATNKAALHSRGEILIYLSDDFKCPKDWDEKIVQALNVAQMYGEKPVLIKVDDCLQDFNVRVLTIPIMNRALYKVLGYFWHPDYKSMFVDQDLFEVCEKHNWIFNMPGLKFPHEHPANGKSQNDETYKRSALNWDQGKETFAKRKSYNFPL